MWARVVEIMTAVWLALSPFIFRAQDDLFLIWIDSGVALAIWIFSGLSWWPPTRWAYLFNLLVAGGLVAFGRFGTEVRGPTDENHIIVGLFLLMIAVIPNESTRPPACWMQPAEGTEEHGS